VPVCTTLESAFTELSADGQRRYRRRARASLPATRSSIRRCRELTAQRLTAWSRTDFIHVVSTVATELVETALADTDSDFSLRVETDGSTVSVAIQHVGMATPMRRKFLGGEVSGHLRYRDRQYHLGCGRPGKPLLNARISYSPASKNRLLQLVASRAITTEVRGPSIFTIFSFSSLGNSGRAFNGALRPNMGVCMHSCFRPARMGIANQVR
jgi:hypothetical protein